MATFCWHDTFKLSHLQTIYISKLLKLKCATTTNAPLLTLKYTGMFHNLWFGLDVFDWHY